jgi:hypothetical protein
MARGRKPNLKRRGQAAELPARGLTLAEVGPDRPQRERRAGQADEAGYPHLL